MIKNIAQELGNTVSDWCRDLVLVNECNECCVGSGRGSQRRGVV